MCGIVGIWAPGGGRDTAVAHARAVRRMARAVQHRGPDGEGFFSDTAPGAQLFLGHRRLAIFDPSPAGAQPMTSADGRFTVAYNGAIYNFVELLAELGLSPAELRSRTDTEVLLHAWAAWGPACLPRLNGMFAAALWDARERALYLFRDRFGKKPLYYAIGDGSGPGSTRGCVAFGSEIKAVLASAVAAPTVEPGLLAEFLRSRDTDHDPERTALSPVRQVPAGCYVRVDVARGPGMSLPGTRYFALQPPGDPGEQRLLDDALVEETRALLRSAMALRLRADVPIGGTLSGGLDSSLLTALATGPLAAQAPDYRVFTCQFPDAREPGDETAWAESVLAALRVPDAATVRVTLPPAEFLRDLDDVLFHQEEPIADPSVCAHYALMRAVSRSGVRVVVSGQGGDEVFAGYGSYVYALLGALLRDGGSGPGLLRFIGELRSRQALAREPALRLLLGAGYHALPGALREALRALRLRAEFPLAPTGRALLASAPPRFSGPLPGLCGGPPARWDRLPFDVYLLDCVARWSLPHILRHDDRNSMAHGVESRAPYLDYRLMELLLQTHPTARIGDGYTKRLLRQVARGLLPEPVRLRVDKRGFFAPQRELLWASEDAVRGACARLPSPLSELTDGPRWLAVLDAFFGRGGRERDGRLVGQVWAGFVVSLWLTRTVPRLGALAVD